MNRPRISPLQPIPSRPAKAKHALKSNLSRYSIRGADTIPGYIKLHFPKQTLATYRAMENAVYRYLDTPNGMQYGIPSPAMLKNLFEGLI